MPGQAFDGIPSGTGSSTAIDLSTVFEADTLKTFRWRGTAGDITQPEVSDDGGTTWFPFGPTLKGALDQTQYNGSSNLYRLNRLVAAGASGLGSMAWDASGNSSGGGATGNGLTLPSAILTGSGAQGLTPSSGGILFTGSGTLSLPLLSTVESGQSWLVVLGGAYSTTISPSAGDSIDGGSTYVLVGGGGTTILLTAGPTGSHIWNVSSKVGALYSIDAAPMANVPTGYVGNLFQFPNVVMTGAEVQTITTGQENYEIEEVLIVKTGATGGLADTVRVTWNSGATEVISLSTIPVGQIIRNLQLGASSLVGSGTNIVVTTVQGTTNANCLVKIRVTKP